MAVQFIAKEAFPTYIAESADVVSGSIIGTPLIGRTVYLTDDETWHIIVGASGSSFELAPFVMPKLET